MSIRRSTLASTAALGLAALALTACEPGGTATAGSSASASAPATRTPAPSGTATAGSSASASAPAPSASAPTGGATATAGASATASASATPTNRPSPSASASAVPTPTGSATPTPPATPSASASATGTPTSASPTPTADCTTAANNNIGPVIHVSSLSDSGITADRAQFHCGPDVPDDGYWQGTGHVSLYPVTPNTTYRLFDQKDSSTGFVTVSKQTFWQIANDCVANPLSAPKPYGCYGNMYAVTLGPGNTITSINELYHP